MQRRMLDRLLASSVACLAVACAGISAPQISTQSLEAPNALPSGLSYERVVRTEDPVFVAHVLEIDLTRRDLKFAVTRGDQSRGMEYVGKRTSTTVGELDAVVGINASYFLPFAGGSAGGDDYYPKEGEPVNASGAVLASGETVSPPEDDLDIRVNAMVCFQKLRIQIEDGQVCPAGFTDGVAAGPRLLADGNPKSFARFDQNYASSLHPRTALGVSDDGTRAWLVVVDGRQKGYSEGISLDALTQLFANLGATNAINLDGGGSATLAISGEDGYPEILNRPIHTGVAGRERPVANHILILRSEVIP